LRKLSEKEKALNNISQIEIPELFFNKILKQKSSKDITNALKQYSLRHNYNLDALMYFFIKKTIDQDILFLSDDYKNKLGDIYLYTIKWASLMENRRIDRISSASKIKEIKKRNLIVDLETSAVLSINRINQDKPFLKKALLKDTINLFFQMRGIKRKTFYLNLP